MNKRRTNVRLLFASSIGYTVLCEVIPYNNVQKEKR